jgi:hypothetical protein
VAQGGAEHDRVAGGRLKDVVRTDRPMRHPARRQLFQHARDRPQHELHQRRLGPRAHRGGQRRSGRRGADDVIARLSTRRRGRGEPAMRQRRQQALHRFGEGAQHPRARRQAGLHRQRHQPMPALGGGSRRVLAGNHGEGRHAAAGTGQRARRIDAVQSGDQPRRDIGHGNPRRTARSAIRLRWHAGD